MAKANYNEDSIKVLKGLEAVRAKPSMYIGLIDSYGLFTILREVMDNTVDEFYGGRNKECTITLEKDGTCIVSDAGQGIPVGIHKTEKIPTIQVIFSSLHAGGKLQKSTAYKQSVGCFVGSTKIELVDGRTVSFKQLYKECQQGKKNYVWTIDRKTGELRAQPIKKVHKTGYTTKLVKITLDTGESFTCTPDHPLYTTALKKIKAENSEDRSLMAIDFAYDSDGYRVLANSWVGQGRLQRIVASYYGQDIKNKHVHHKDHNKLNNNPENLEALTPAEHYLEHPEKLERWMKYVNDTASEKSELLTAFNYDEDFKLLNKKARAVRVGVKLIREGKKITYDNYDLTRNNSHPRSENLYELFGSLRSFRNECYEVNDWLNDCLSRDLNLGKRYLESLSFASDTHKNNMTNNHSPEMIAKLFIGKAIKSLEPYDDDVIESSNILELNELFRANSNSVSCRALCQYIDIEEFISCYLNEVDPVSFIYEDLSEDARDERRHKYDVDYWKMRSENWPTCTINRSANDYLRKVNALLDAGLSLTRENFEKLFSNALGNSVWYSGKQACALKGLTTKNQVIKAAKTMNHKVVSVELIEKEQEVPVYDMTVCHDHNYRLACGVFVGNTHGIGAKCSNALSTEFECYTNRDGQWYHISWAKGKLTSELSKVKKPKEHPYKTGTLIRFKPDLSIFDKGSKLDPELVTEWAETTAYLSDGYKININNNIGKPKTETFYFKNGVQDWLNDLVEELDCTILNSKPIRVKTEHCDFILSFSDAEGNNLYGYCNGLYQADGGNHLNTMLSILYSTLKEYANSRQNFTRDDMSEGLLGIINFKIDSPRFSSQTKEKLTDGRFEELCKSTLEKEINEFFKKNKTLAKTLCERASSLRGAKEQFTMQKRTLQELKKRQKDVSKMPGKLTVVKSCKPEERELFLVEGDSAAGTASAARMTKPYRYQETLGLKGKITNSLKAKTEAILNSEEVLNILTAIGYDPTTQDPLAKLRVGKIILLADADSDGAHINSLILTLFYKLMPRVFERGLVYTVDGPKYVLNDGGKQYFAQTMEELKAQLPKGVNPDRASYLKGWGEANATALREIAFDPSTRRLRQITKPTKAQMQEFELLMGDNTDYRKEMLGVS